MLWFNVITNFRTFQLEAAGIGDAIDRVLNLLIVAERGEYVRQIEETAAPDMRLAA